MALNDDDVREILRIIDESDLDELRIETEGLSLHVLRGGVPSSVEPEPARATPSTATEAPGDASARDPGGPTITSPMIGTFYRAPAPGEPPFVEVGSRVEPDTIVCIVEVMKMMNSVAAGISGTITELLVENASPVEYGSPLFRVDTG
jgi:acetyl-CoA carboxylase biotin carboxyl carrier protein